MQFRHQIKRGLEKTPCCKHRIKTARQRDDDVIDKAGMRRSKESANVKWGTRRSVMAGDYNIATSMKLLAMTQNYQVGHNW